MLKLFVALSKLKRSIYIINLTNLEIYIYISCNTGDKSVGYQLV